MPKRRERRSRNTGRVLVIVHDLDVRAPVASVGVTAPFAVVVRPRSTKPRAVIGSVPDHCPAMGSHGSVCEVRLSFQHLCAVPER
jgi:hypothetical protein